MSKIMIIFFHPDQKACEFAAQAVRHYGNMFVQQGTLEKMASARIRYPVLKENSFRWAPSQGAWQQQLTANGRYAARRVIEKIKAQ